MLHLPLKKRALNHGDGRGSSPDESPKKKRPVDGCVVGAESKDAAGGRDDEAPAPLPVPAPSAVASAASAKTDAKAEAFSAAAKWLKKGTWTVAQQGSPPAVAAPPQPPAKKLMHDAIRSSAPPNERHRRRAAAEDEKKRSRSDNDGVPRPNDDDADLGEPLRRRLAELGATRPRFVYRKALQKSDVCPNQNRLLVSCKREAGLEGCPITACFSPLEWERVRNKDVGLAVTALDRGGAAHALTCKFLQSNGGYRFISGWKDFLQQNGVELDSRGRWTRDVDVELRAFRSRALKRQPPVDEDGKLVRAVGVDGKPDKNLQVPDHFHPNGSLGLVLLHHERRRRRVADRDDDGDFQGTAPSLPVAREKGKKQRDKPAPTAAWSPAARAGAAAEPVESETMSKVEMIDKYGEPTSNAMIGLIMLRGVSSEERQGVETAAAAVSKEKHDSADAEGGHGA